MIKTSKGDVIWNFAASFLKVGSSAILLPVILSSLSSNEIGFYFILTTMNYLTSIIDFGFSSTFGRNVTYVFQGVKKFHSEGITDSISKDIDYRLLKSLIIVMKRYYFFSSIVLGVLSIFIGELFLFSNLQAENINNVRLVFYVNVVVNLYTLFSQYYSSLLLGSGKISQLKKFTIFGQLLFILLASITVLFGFGLVGVVISQGIGIYLTRWLSKRSFFDNNMTSKISSLNKLDLKRIFRKISPNAIKLGLTSLGAFAVTRSSMFIGTEYLSIEEIGVWGVVMQFGLIPTVIISAYYSSYLPEIAALRVTGNTKKISSIYMRAVLVNLFVHIVVCLLILLVGSWIFSILTFNISFPSSVLIALYFVVVFLENNHTIAAHFLVSKNSVPFYKASLFAGFSTIFLLVLFLDKFKLDLLAMVLAPGLAQVVYQNWKWPSLLIKDLNISFLNLHNIWKQK